MAKTLTEKEKQALIADHKTGQYSQRKLAGKYSVSVGFVNKLIKEIDKIDAEVVNAGIVYKSALSERDEHSVNAIEHAVNEATKHLLYFNNSALKNQSIANKKLNENMNITELESHSRITSRNKETVLGKSPDNVINNTNANQVNTENTVVFKRITSAGDN